MNIENITPDNRLRTKFTLLSESDYKSLNEKISRAFGYLKGKSTEIYTSETPELAKINIAIVDEKETFDTIAVMKITAEVQEKFPELLTGIELVDSYVPIVAKRQEMPVTIPTEKPAPAITIEERMTNIEQVQIEVITILNDKGIVS